MDFASLFLRPPVRDLDESVKDFIREALGEEESVSTPDELAEILAPFLEDAGLVTEEREVLVFCRDFFTDAGVAIDTAPQRRQALPMQARPLGALGGVTDDNLASAWEIASGVDAKPIRGYAGEASSAGKSTKSGARVAAANALAAIEDSLKDDEAVFRLRDATDTKIAETLTSLLSSEWSNFGGSALEVQPNYVCAVFIEASTDLREGRLRRWRDCLASVLEEVGLQPEDLEEHTKRLDKFLQVLVRKGLLEAIEKLPEVGDLLQALLPEDDAWHPVLIESVSDADTIAIIFFEYGKPQTVTLQDLRPLAAIADDEDAGDLKDGKCEMCEREMKLTFHHLIPKDTHPTYLKKRLPRGIEGEPTRGFLNGYGLMICRKCHNMVHRLASNSVLAVEYNTLEKLLAQPMISTWIEHAKKQRY